MTSPVNWDVEDVSNFLKENSMSQYASEFQINKINGKAFMLLNESHLKELGVETIIHRLKLMKKISDFRHGGGSINPTNSQSSQPRIQFGNVPGQKPPPPAPPQQSSSPQLQQTMKKAPPSPKHAPETSYNDYEPPQPRGPPSARASMGASGGGRSAPPPPVKKAAPKPKPMGVGGGGGGQAPAVKRSLRKAPPPPADDPNDDRRPCAYCGRKFASDRLDKHEAICARASSKHTKVFDSKKQRLSGTEAAAYQGRSRDVKVEKTINGVPKYKIAHQQLVESMRAARKLAAYEKAVEEGRAVGPPPELPKIELVDDDRVQCPHCGRKFGQVQAERHIPNCTGGSMASVGRPRMNTRGGRRY